jgi:hypothetical protein
MLRIPPRISSVGYELRAKSPTFFLSHGNSVWLSGCQQGAPAGKYLMGREIHRLSTALMLSN